MSSSPLMISFLCFCIATNRNPDTQTVDPAQKSQQQFLNGEKDIQRSPCFFEYHLSFFRGAQGCQVKYTNGYTIMLTRSKLTIANHYQNLDRIFRRRNSEKGGRTIGVRREVPQVERGFGQLFQLYSVHIVHQTFEL